MPTISPHEFVTHDGDHSGFNEEQGAQSFFNDLCGLVGHPTPTDLRQSRKYSPSKSRSPEAAKPTPTYEEHFVWEFKGQDDNQLDQAHSTQAVALPVRHLKNAAADCRIVIQYDTD